MKFNIGCGPRNFGKDWIHIDGSQYPHIDSSDIYLKSFNNCSAELIYASHFIEYFDREEIISILECWKKKLKKNGKLRIAVPDFKACANLYLNRSYSLDSFLGPFYGKMKMGKEFIYHRTVYDLISIKKLLEDIGMRNIIKYDWRKTQHSKFDDHSQAYLPHMDKKNGTLISLNVECIK
tara:strand:- start:381 stop:917 length:537 start_codon:yes stop_codon:yes gene_type:complete